MHPWSTVWAFDSKLCDPKCNMRLFSPVLHLILVTLGCPSRCKTAGQTSQQSFMSIMQVKHKPSICCVSAGLGTLLAELSVYYAEQLKTLHKEIEFWNKLLAFFSFPNIFCVSACFRGNSFHRHLEFQTLQ